MACSVQTSLSQIRCSLSDLQIASDASPAKGDERHGSHMMLAPDSIYGLVDNNMQEYSTSVNRFLQGHVCVAYAAFSFHRLRTMLLSPLIPIQMIQCLQGKPRCIYSPTTVVVSRSLAVLRALPTCVSDPPTQQKVLPLPHQIFCYSLWFLVSPRKEWCGHVSGLLLMVLYARQRSH